MLILHYTGMPSCEDAIRCLASPQSGVSCHYVVDEDGAITQMVPEAFRAWHAGVSYWQGIEDINSCSIGIEIHNPGHDGAYPDFPDAQMAAVEALCLDIVDRNGIPPRRVLAHSDVAPRRKIDPGEKFDWAKLAQAGIGHWVEPADITCGDSLELGDAGDGVMNLQRNSERLWLWDRPYRRFRRAHPDCRFRLSASLSSGPCRWPRRPLDGRNVDSSS